MLTNISYRHTNNFHLINYFPVGISNVCSWIKFVDYIKLENFYDSLSHCLDNCQEVEEVQFLLIVISDPHDLEKVPKQDHVISFS